VPVVGTNMVFFIVIILVLIQFDPS